MKITPINLAKRVERWQKRLPYAGIASVRIECVTLTDEVPGNPGAIAGAATCDDYDSVHFYFDQEYLETANSYQLDEVIVHEWLHVVMRDYDESLNVIEGWMPPHTYEDFRARIIHEREKLVDRLARQIVALYHGRTSVH